MVGRRHWESAEATIVATQVAVTTAAGYVDRLEYAVDVHPADGSAFRVTLREPKFIKGGFHQPQIGDVVGVLFDPKTHDAKFDTSDQRLTITFQEQREREAFETAASGAPGTAAPGMPDQIQVLSGADAGPIVNALLSNQSIGGVEGIQALRRDGDGPAERLAKLDDLKAKGLVSDAEYGAQRQRIIDAI
ncbi:MAG TPA: SHOCT domain-containing protein [Acidimicrobiia bacterium]|nr:SHOCT domain-containing protein [Acidimicrobiia bacterium]